MPLKALITHFKEARTIRRINFLTVDISDEFTEFSGVSILYIVYLNNIIDVAEIYILRLKYRYTCG